MLLIQVYIDVEWTIKVLQHGMLRIFLREISMLCWDFPIDTEGIIEDADTTIGFRMIEVITLILEDSSLGEDGKAVGKTLWNKELTMIVLCQLYLYMLAICWRSLADIYCYIKHSTLHASYQLALGIWRTLEM